MTGKRWREEARVASTRRLSPGCCLRAPRKIEILGPHRNGFVLAADAVPVGLSRREALKRFGIKRKLRLLPDGFFLLRILHLLDNFHAYPPFLETIFDTE